MAKKVLVVEDESALRLFLSYYLRGMGHDVCAVATAEDAIRVISNGFDLVITDNHLGQGMSGLGFIAWLREHKYTMPIILCSAKFPQGLPSRCVYLPKPFALDELAEAMDISLRKTAEFPISSMG